MSLKREQLIAYAIKYKGEYRKILNALRKSESWQSEYQMKALTIVDEDYPACFWQLEYPPLCLFYKGDITLLGGSMIGIVGSRDPSEDSLEETETIVKFLKNHYSIVSGLARGIDQAAHQAAIAYDRKTIGILANGIDYCYPRQNEKLYQKMCRNHLILSEYPGLTAVERRNFPFRNRMIAALAEKLIIPETKVIGGTMITVDLALQLNKEIYCLPKPLNDEKKGNNLLIKQGANIIGCIEDIKNI